MKKVLKMLGIGILFSVFSLVVPSISLADEGYDWVEYDMNTGTEKTVLFEDIEKDNLPRYLSPVPPSVLSRSKIPGVIGEDERKKVEFPTQYPYSSIGLYRAGGQGSGTMIGPSTVLTCAHVVWNQGFKPYGSFSPGASIDNPYPFANPPAYVEKVYLPKAYIENPSVDTDLAIVQLSMPKGYETGWLGLSYHVGSIIPNNDSFTVTGYPGMFNGDMYTDTKAEWSQEIDYPFVVFTNFDTTPGNSGSALYNSEKIIYGVMTAYTETPSGEPIASIGTRITFERYAMIQHLLTKPVEIKKIAIEPESIELIPRGAESKQLNVKFYPENAETQEIVWESEDSSVVNVDKYGIIKSGIESSDKKTTITATTKDGRHVATCEVSVKDDHPQKFPGTPIEVGNSYSGSYDFYGDYDCFQFQAEANKIYGIEIENNSAYKGYTIFNEDGKYTWTVDQNPTSRTAANGKRYLRFEKPEDAIRGFGFVDWGYDLIGKKYSFTLSELTNAKPTIENKDELNGMVLKVGDKVQIKARANNGAFPDSIFYNYAKDYVSISETGELTALKPYSGTYTDVLDALFCSGEYMSYSDRIYFSIVE
ncbi:Ig-like domain-containing protein [Enterococcus sp. BWM-S5]|uniref:Serine protease n=1 Tax=Enterococcus larvae TaxID=2794352 RepID=A0ABS4CJV6_9ENTE|nr:Ig-like domain-containing protein [Enterococcus larvae]MBP1046759.1 Ig-like domain-containing protein [Enterococcus larvae]